jgi:hypothetical protein
VPPPPPPGENGAPTLPPPLLLEFSRGSSVPLSPEEDGVLPASPPPGEAVSVNEAPDAKIKRKNDLTLRKEGKKWIEKVKELKDETIKISKLNFKWQLRH